MSAQEKIKVILSIKVDPTQSYSKYDREHMIETCGLIPHWVFDHYVKEAEKDLDGAFQRVIENNYEFLGGDLGGNVTIEGLFQYSGDPDLYPMISYEGETETMYQYPYGIIAVVNRDNGQMIYSKRVD